MSKKTLRNFYILTSWIKNYVPSVAINHLKSIIAVNWIATTISSMYLSALTILLKIGTYLLVSSNTLIKSSELKQHAIEYHKLSITWKNICILTNLFKLVMSHNMHFYICQRKWIWCWTIVTYIVRNGLSMALRFRTLIKTSLIHRSFLAHCELHNYKSTVLILLLLCNHVVKHRCL